MKRIQLLSIMCMLGIAFVAACGGSSGGGGSVGGSALSVSSVTPAANATDQAVTVTVTAVFNQAVAMANLTTSTFTLTDVGGLVAAGAVTYDASTFTATFTPTFPLKNLVAYTAKLTTGTGLATEYSWQFTTVSRKIVYDSVRALGGTDAANTATNIWVTSSDGTGAVALSSLTAAGVGSWVPHWSPDSTKIAFESVRAIDGSDSGNPAVNNVWVMNADGSSPTALTRLTVDTAWSDMSEWSPNGTKIAFQSNRKLDGTDAVNAVTNIWVVNSDGSSATALTSSTVAGSNLPQWSPDGAKIAFQSTLAPDGSGAVNAATNIWVVNADGSSATALTSLTVAGANSTSPQWSPDGTKIVYVSSRATGGTNAVNTNNTPNIWTVNADGSGGDTALTSLTAAGAGVNMATPQWSPDGTKISYTSTRALDNSDAVINASNIWVMNSDGSGSEALTTMTAVGADVTQQQWSQDGTKLLFESRRNVDGTDVVSPNNVSNIWVMKSDGTAAATTITALTVAGANSNEAQW